MAQIVIYYGKLLSGLGAILSDIETLRQMPFKHHDRKIFMEIWHTSYRVPFQIQYSGGSFVVLVVERVLEVPVEVISVEKPNKIIFS